MLYWIDNPGVVELNTIRYRIEVDLLPILCVLKPLMIHLVKPYVPLIPLDNQFSKTSGSYSNMRIDCLRIRTQTVCMA